MGRLHVRLGAALALSLGSIAGCSLTLGEGYTNGSGSQPSDAAPADSRSENDGAFPGRDANGPPVDVDGGGRSDGASSDAEADLDAGDAAGGGDADVGTDGAVDASNDASVDAANDASNDASLPVEVIGVGTGRDGAKLINSSVTVNAYTPLAANVAEGSKVLDVVGNPGIAAQDVVLVWQGGGAGAGASGEQSDVSAASLSVGHYQLVRVVGVEGTRLHLRDPLTRAYRAVGGQVVRVPEYETVRVESGGKILATPWNGATGGIAALIVRTLLRIDGRVEADGSGFRGATGAAGATSGCASTLEGPVSFGFSPRGEGLATTAFRPAPTGSDLGGNGNVRNAGGGGNCAWGGGGGGGNGSLGGSGGTWSSNGGPGLGGARITGALENVLLMGGGGGAGNAAGMVGGAGGAGGGVIYLAAASIEGTGAVRSDGAMGDANPGGCGGSGAGGSIVLRALTSATCNVRALGADGRVDPSGSQGGAGGAGHVRLEAASGTCTITAESGVAPTPPAPLFSQGEPLVPRPGLVERTNAAYVP